MDERTTRALSLLWHVFWRYACICVLLRRGLLGIASLVRCILHRYLLFFFRHDCVSSLSCLAVVLSNVVACTRCYDFRTAQYPNQRVGNIRAMKDSARERPSEGAPLWPQS